MHIVFHPRIASLLIAVFLAVAATLQLNWGETSAPMASLFANLFGYTQPLAARLIVGVEIAAAAAVLCVGRRTLNVVVAGSATFIALACVSRAFREGSLAWSAVALVCSGATLWFAVQSSAVAATSRRGLSPAWSALLAIVAATGAGRLAARASFEGTPATHVHTDGEHEGHDHAAASTNTPLAIDLDMHTLVGRRLDDTPLAGYLPMLTDLIGNTPAFIVFYNPECETCHTLIREHFALPRMELVIAVEIPVPESMKVAASGDAGPEPIECANCEMLMLPPGPNWLIAPPTVLKIESGVITCVSDRFKGNCFGTE